MESHKSDLLWYMTFLRLVPMSPNWLINVTAPIVGVPFFTFAGSVFIGLMPYNFCALLFNPCRRCAGTAFLNDDAAQTFPTAVLTSPQYVCRQDPSSRQSPA